MTTSLLVSGKGKRMAETIDMNSENAVETLRLEEQIIELNRRRAEIAAELGASLYEATKDDAVLRQGREALYDGIAACDSECEACRAEIERIEEAEKAAAEAAAAVVVEETSVEVADVNAVVNCVICGTAIQPDDAFCCGCGTPVDKARPQAVEAATTESASLICVVCGTAMQPGDAFCCGCGTSVDKALSQGDASAAPAPEAAGKVCASCGAPMGDEDLFCMACGTRA